MNIMEFNDNKQLMELIGPNDVYLRRIEKELGMTLALRGNRITLVGSDAQQEYGRRVLVFLQEHQTKSMPINDDVISMALRYIKEEAIQGEIPCIINKKRTVIARSPLQGRYIQAMQKHEMVIAAGPAGTGKTYLAAAMGVAMLTSGHVDRIILTRPAVEAGERLGFLPGDLKEKIDPFLRPLYDALHDAMPMDQVMKHIHLGDIEIAPLAFMRGRTLTRAFVILDEAQNTTPVQMKMFLTRLGSGSRMVITGDLTQIDLPAGVVSGLHQAVDILEGVEGVCTIKFDEDDIVRHPLVGRIVKAYRAKGL